MKKNRILTALILIISNILVGVTVFAVTMMFAVPKRTDKLAQLKHLIMTRYVGEYDETELEDGAAVGMLAATGDRWSYYIPASQYEALMQSQSNSDYVGVGISIVYEEAGTRIVSVVSNGPANEAGVLPDDLIVAVDGTNVVGKTTDEVAALVQGAADTKVKLTLKRGEDTLEITVTRRAIAVIVAEGKMLEGNIGLVTINNFNDKCAQETIAAIDQLVEQGAKGLVFDVRGNPGGRVDQLTKVLDHLLPKGEIFHSVETGGKDEYSYSDDKCIQLPMAVIVNGDSYSAAEFFAAALSEYDWATVVGEQTVGKSYFQYTYRLYDGSAVALSSGKYFTPKGVSLAEVGGLTPDIPLELTAEQRKLFNYGRLEPMEDPQILAAIESLGLS